MDFRNGLISNRAYNGLNEAIENEAKVRRNWSLRYDRLNERFPNKSMYTWAGMFDILKYEDESKKKFKLPELKFPPQKVDYTNEVDAYLKNIGVKDENLKISLDEMYKIPNETKKSLIEGVSHEKGGRYKYLHDRHKILPEERYKFPICSSMAYGWRMNDFYKTTDMQAEQNLKAKFIIKSEMKDTFYRTNGAFDENNEKLKSRRIIKD